MSKTRTRIHVTLHSGEAFVIATKEFWDGLADVCDTLATEHPGGSQEYWDWKDIASDIRNQSEQNLFTGGLTDDEW